MTARGDKCQMISIKNAFKIEINHNTYLVQFIIIDLIENNY